ncbi:MAG: hydrogenase nickel incorporation protein HypB [Bacteroidota bacterium]
MSIVTIERKVLEKNDEIARKNRNLFASRKIFAINVVSSPGSGKTSILERTLEHFNGKIPVAVIEGDVQTDLDAQRIAKYNVPVVQVVTNGMCHLEAKFVHDSLSAFDGKNIRLLIIENVGNLVCPSNYDLGEAHKIVVLSTTEGDDKPLKYPAMFRNASVLLINKIDLVPYVNCNVDTMVHNAMTINPKLKIFKMSCTTNEGIPEWCGWVGEQLKK